VFKNIVDQRMITITDRENAWKRVKYSVGSLRPFCRGPDGESALDEPRYIPIKNIEWRFGAY